MSERSYPPLARLTSQPAWPLPFIAFVQVWFGTSLISPLREPGAPWNGGYATLSAIGGLAGLALLALAARNCGRLWRLPPEAASWALVVSTALVAAFSVLVASGPLTMGVWHWWVLAPAALAGFLLVMLPREVSRKLARGKGSSDLTSP